ncbi:MAG: hypothetical protein ACYTEL_26505 [Planctomycetota bacterium]|jgi:hypothetical protein
MIEAGLELERKSHQFLSELGYFVIPRLRIFNVGFREETDLSYEELTDIDLYGVKFDKFLNKTSIIVDCKLKSGGFNKQILSNVGIKKIIEPSFFYMIRQLPMRAETRRLADLYGIKIFEKKFIEKNINPSLDFGSFKIASYEKICEMMKNKDSYGKSLISDVLFPLQHTIAIKDEFKRLIKSISVFSNLKDMKPSNDNKPLWEYLVMSSFQVIFLNLIEISTKLVESPSKFLRNEILFGLNPEYDFKMKMIENLNRIDAGKQGGKKGKITLTDISPTNSEEIITSIRNIIKESKYIQKLLLFNDFIIHELLLHGKRPDIKQLMKQFNLSRSEVYVFSKLNKSVINAITFKENIPPVLLDLT